jgi:hypothetical protein
MFGGEQFSSVVSPKVSNIRIVRRKNTLGNTSISIKPNLSAKEIEMLQKLFSQIYIAI